MATKQLDTITTGNSRVVARSWTLAGAAFTQDGVHPNFTYNTNSFGGHLVLKAPAVTKIAA